MIVHQSQRFAAKTDSLCGGGTQQKLGFNYKLSEIR